MQTGSNGPVRPSRRQQVRLGILFLLVLTFPLLMNYFSVFLIVQSSGEGVIAFSWFWWVAFTVTALFLGRAACGWACPLGAYQETKERMVPRRLVRVRGLPWLRYFLATAWVGAIGLFAVKAGGYNRVDLLYRTESGVSVDSAVQWLSWAMVVSLLLLPAFFLGRRSFCHYFCPWGVLNMLVTRLRDALRLPGLRLSVKSDRCQACGTCTANCPMTLPVQDMVRAGKMRHRECILCGTCADNCPHGVITYGWQAADKGSPESLPGK